VSLAADAAGPERSCVGADFFECVGERFDVGVGEVLGEVSLDSVSVVAAGRPSVSVPLSVRTMGIVRRSFSGRARRTSAASSIRSTTRVKPLLLYLVQGNVTLLDAEGNAYEVTDTIALCRCGLSATKPFCDSNRDSVSVRVGASGRGVESLACASVAPMSRRGSLSGR
jgi:CDGSH-type Zn-finger protein